MVPQPPDPPLNNLQEHGMMDCHGCRGWWGDQPRQHRASPWSESSPRPKPKKKTKPRPWRIAAWFFSGGL